MIPQLAAIALALGAGAPPAVSGQDSPGAPAAAARPTNPEPLPGGSWTHLGRTPWRTPWAQGPDTGPADLDSVAWVADEDDLGRDLVFIGGVGVVVHAGLVCTTALADGEPVALAFDAQTGACAWSAPIQAPFASSWSTPAIDRRNATLLVGAGAELRALNLSDGSTAWVAPLVRPVVNASPVVTADRGPRDRAFITDYSLFDLGAPGRLYCVNVDPFDGAANPHHPGEILWAALLAPGEIGASPSYAAGRVIIATSDGRVLAFPADAETTPAPLWAFTNDSGDGFFGPVSVYDGAVFAATYDFGVGQLAAEMVRLDAATGALRWSVPCNRSDAAPIPLGEGLVALSGGVPPDPFFFNHRSAPSLALFQDLGPAAVMLWDSALDTWDDDGDGVLETGEFLSVGGWSHTPALVRTPAGPRLFAGSMDDDDLGGALFLPCATLRLIDPMRAPSHPLFALDLGDGVGGSPAIVGDTLYSIGPAGLVAVRTPGRARHHESGGRR